MAINIKILPLRKTEREFTQSERKFLTLLETDQNFIEIVEKFWKDNDIPLGGFPVGKELQKLHPSNFIDAVFAAEEISVMLRTINKLPPQWDDMFGMILVHCKVYHPQKYPIRIHTTNNQLLIEIRDRITLSELQEFIKTNKQILEHIQKIPSVPRLTSLDTGLMKKVTKLLNEDQTTSEIKDKLNKEFAKRKSDIFEYYSYSSVHAMIHRYRNIHKKYLRNSSTDRFIYDLTKQIK